MLKNHAVEYHVAAESDPHGQTFTRKRDAIRDCKRMNRTLYDDDGETLPRPSEWTDEQYAKYDHLIYEVTAHSETEDGKQYGDVDMDGRIDWMLAA